MSRRAALFTQADIARAIRAGRQEGASAIEITADGRILVVLSPSDDTIVVRNVDKPVDSRRIVPL